MSNYIIDIQNTTDELIQMNDNRVEISIAFDEDDKWKAGSSFVTPAFCPQVKIMPLYVCQAAVYRINSCQRNPLMSCQSTYPRF